MFCLILSPNRRYSQSCEPYNINNADLDDSQSVMTKPFTTSRSNSSQASPPKDLLHFTEQCLNSALARKRKYVYRSFYRYHIYHKNQ